MSLENKVDSRLYTVIKSLARSTVLMTLAVAPLYAIACGSEESAAECATGADCVKRCQERAQNGREFDQCKERGFYCGRRCGERTMETERGTRTQPYCENACCDNTTSGICRN